MGEDRLRNASHNAEATAMRIFARLFAFLLFITLYACSHGPRIPQPVENPLSSEERFRLAEIYEGKGEYDLAFREYRAVSQDDGDNADVWFAMGTLSLKMKKYGEADGYFAKAIGLNPDNAAYLNNRAWLRMETGRLDEAASDAGEAAKKDPARRYIYLDTLGVIQMRKELLKEAEASLNEAVSAAPVGDRAGLKEIYTHLLELYRRTGDKEKAAGVEDTLRGLR
ncbi:MAG: tetratricopeptide repeat protein [Deltaproteobacteria bacterium]|nr:tetratricopeptide repeat protein [Deltaproteobacteria bacterium]